MRLVRRLRGGVQRVRRSLGRRRPRVVLGAALVACAALGGWQVLHAPGRAFARTVLEEQSLARIEALAPEVRRAAREFDLEPSLVAAIVYAESRGRVDAVSSAGALGLMQLMPAAVADAARALGIPEPSREQLLSDGALNLRLGARHFAWTLRHEERDVERALCAYNAGRGRLRGWIDEHGSYAAWRRKQLADGDSGVLAYARGVLEAQRRFIERGVF